jgi:inorganic pyrophosphatase
MGYSNIEPKNKDGTVNVIIEIPADGMVKYELDWENEIVYVDRFSMTTMMYPCNYGSIPNTLGGDGDPIDVLMITRFPLVPGVVIKGRVIGVLKMSDEGGEDAKIICVPTSKADKLYDNIKNLNDLPEIEKNKIKHFFEHYKDLEPEKWVKIDSWGSGEDALKIIDDAISSTLKVS